jgi:hypothetical protein
MFVYLNLHIEFPMLRYLIKIHVIPLQPRLSKTASPCKVFFHWTPELLGLGRQIGHRGLELDGAIGQGKICNSLKSEKISKSFLSHIGNNKIKF